ALRADGLATMNAAVAAGRDIGDACRGAGGTGPLAIQVHVSLAGSLDEAWAIARHQWRNHALGAPFDKNLATPEEFDAAARDRDVPDEDIARSAIITDSVPELVDRVRAFEELGFDEVYLHHVGQDQAAFLDLAERELLPALRAAG